MQAGGKAPGRAENTFVARFLGESKYEEVCFGADKSVGGAHPGIALSMLALNSDTLPLGARSVRVPSN